MCAFTHPLGMNMNDIKLEARRHFLRFLAGSPLLASLRTTPGFCDDLEPAEVSNLISEPGEAINVFDFEKVAEHELPLAHWGFLKSGVGDDGSVRANRDAFSNYYMRPRRLVGVSEIDMSVKLFGTKWETPIALCPAASQGAFYEDGELAVAQAAKNKRHLMILSTYSSNSVTDVAEAYGGPIWFQLYAQANFEVTRGLIAKAEAAGCPAIVVTVDQIAGGNRDTLNRYRKLDTRECSDCHTGEPKPNFEGLKRSGGLRAGLTWDSVKRLRGITDRKLLLKGIVTGEDAKLCLEHGVDGIIVSNHGGRSESSNWASLDSLPEVVQAVDGKVPVLIDGGFRRGMDFFKALALGADAVCIGRPYLWGLAAFGQEGVEQVLEILRREVRMAMMTAGTPSIKDIKRSHLAAV